MTIFIYPMGLQVQFYIQSGLTGIALVVYILLFIYQRNYIRKLRTHMGDIDKAFDTYKKMVNIDDIERHTNIRIQNAVAEESKKHAEVLGVVSKTIGETIVQAAKEGQSKVQEEYAGTVIEMGYALANYMILAHKMGSPQINENIDKLLSRSPDSIRDYVKSQVVSITKQYTKPSQIKEGPHL